METGVTGQTQALLSTYNRSAHVKQVTWGTKEVINWTFNMLDR